MPLKKYLGYERDFQILYLRLFTFVISRKCTLNMNIDNTAMTNTPAHIHKYKSSQRGTLIYSISDTVDFLTGLPWVRMASLGSGKQEGSA